MSQNLGTRRPSWLAKLCYVAIGFVLLGFVAFAVLTVWHSDDAVRGAAGPLSQDSQGGTQPPLAPAPRQTR
jgi:hypothetical protein